MKIVYKKTTDLTQAEVQELCKILETVFEGVERSLKEFLNEFLNTCLGYSFHGLLLDDTEHIVGAQSYIPFYYFVKGEKMLFTVGVDTMLLKEYRNFDNIMDLWSIGRALLKKEGCVFNFGFPNENSYPLYVKAMGDKEIGDLSVYILPYKIGGIKKKLNFLNPFSKVMSFLLLKISSFSFNTHDYSFPIRQERISFEKTRYNWFIPSEYQIIDVDKVHFVYKIKNYEGIRCAFLFDVYPLTSKNFNRAVREIHKRSKKDFDMIMYVGHLAFSPISMIKVPKKRLPKTFHFVGSILDPSKLDSNLIFNVNNWSVDLASYDLI